jgi:branched-chain amino acid transport system substrate-binding protein
MTSRPWATSSGWRAMRAERRLPAIAAAVLTAALLGAGCSADRAPVRVGVLLECTGLLVGSRDSVLAAVSLPLLERGGSRTSELVTGSAGGRRIELVPTCTEFTYPHKLVLATRRLVEVDGVDAVVGPIGGGESVVFRDLARRFPDVTFLASEMGAQETTLRDPPPNYFRYAPTGPQTTAGLGTYAYRDLGWRRAVVVAEDWYPGWEGAAGFVAEFCALGGNVVERDWYTLFGSDPRKAARRHAATADGVLVIATSGFQVPYLTAYVGMAKPARERLLLTGAAFLDPTALQPPGVDLSGVVISGAAPRATGSDVMRRYREAFAREFPELPPGVGEGMVELPAYAAVEALVEALDETDGDLGRGQAELRRTLAGLVLDVPQGAVRLDRNRQSSQAIYLERIEPRTPGATPRTRLVRRIDGVDQTFEGIFGPRTPAPSKTDPTCGRRPAPPWAS